MDVTGTLINDFIVDYMEGQNLTAAELNTAKMPLLDFFMRNQLFDADKIMEGKKYPSHVVKQPVMQDGDIVVGNSFALSVADQDVNSAYENYVFTPYSFTISMYPANFASNEIGYQAVFNEKLRRSLEKLTTTVETEKCYNLLEASKNQVWDAEVIAQFAASPAVPDALQVSLAEADNAYDKFRDIMSFYDFRSEGIQVAASNFHRQFISNLGAQGNANSINKAYKLDAYDFNFSNRIPQGASNNATVYFMEQNSVGLGMWLPTECKEGLQTLGGAAQFGVTETLPILGMPMGYLYTDELNNGAGLHNGTGGSGATVRQTFQFMVYITSKALYNSDPVTRFQPIVKAEFLNA